MRKTKNLISVTILMLIVLALTTISVFTIFIKNVYAEDNINMSVSVGDSLYIEVSENPTLTLNPLNNNIDTTSFTVTAGTNNLYGYELYMSANTTDLTRDNSDGISATIPTLDQDYSINNFPTNKWGYKLSTATNYSPFDNTETLISSSSEPTSNSTTFDLAAKVDYDKPAGSYSLTFDFSIISVPEFPVYMQDFAVMSSKQRQTVIALVGEETAFPLIDKRDRRTYYVAKLKDGEVWMLQNLRIGADTSTLTLTAGDSDVEEDFVLTNKLSDGKFPYTTISGTSYVYDSQAYYCTDNYGCWYNWYTATAGTGVRNTASGNVETSICPAGWTLPTGGSSGQLATLYRAYGSPLSMLVSPTSSTENAGGVSMPGFLLSGDYHYNGAHALGSSCYYWSRTAASAQRAYDFLLTTSAVTLTQNYYKYDGVPVRCLLKI